MRQRRFGCGVDTKSVNNPIGGSHRSADNLTCSKYISIIKIGRNGAICRQEVLMDFQDQVGKIVYCEVQKWGGKLSFGVEFLVFDRLLHSVRTSEECTRDMRRIRHPEYPANVMNDRTYSSIRLFHVNRPNEASLSDGQIWKCEVAKCYHDPSEALTRDGRRRIHFSLNASRLALDGENFLDEETSEMILLTQLPNRMCMHREKCAVHRRRYRIDAIKSIVYVPEGFRADSPTVVFGLPHYVPFDEFIGRQRRAYGDRQISKVLFPEEIPSAPDNLLQFLIKIAT